MHGRKHPGHASVIPTVAYLQAAVFTRGQHVSVQAPARAARSNAFELAYDSAGDGSAIKLVPRRPAAAARGPLEIPLAESLSANQSPDGALGWYVILFGVALPVLYVLGIRPTEAFCASAQGPGGSPPEEAFP